ncbi:hypothetical protein FUAX_06070 [Fulvitalea axinellae]|uniref:DUF5017 domain-containing protein n=1 Tax=Fulvitalea axinellae TaxID=1182444 RepID=A0AAU9D7L7_9BACT|nr:hypothetical protein FUAX_06070 [Fulvitalea axinellae]
MKMKRYILSAAVVSMLGFAACDSTEDMYDEIDKDKKAQNDFIKGNLPKSVLPEGNMYTMVEADYTAIGDDIAKYKNFSKYNPAKNFLPDFLGKKFVTPDAGDEPTLKITFKFYTSSVYNDEFSMKDYKLVSEDYDAFGTGDNDPGKFNNFSSKNDNKPEEYVAATLRTRYPSAVEGNTKLVEYVYRGSTEKYEVFSFDGTVWTKSEQDAGFNIDDAYSLSNDDYTSMGTEDDQPGKYKNFSYSTKTEDFLPDFLKAKYTEAKAGAKQTIKFKYYGNNVEANHFTFDGAKWMLSENVTVAYDWSHADKGTWEVTSKIPSTTENVTEEYTYKQKKKMWATDPAKKITLVNNDYKVTDDGTYYNFYVKGKTEEEATTIVLEKVEKILEANYSPQQDVIYAVTYDYYDGARKTGTIRVIKDKDTGKWRLSTEADDERLA